MLPIKDLIEELRDLSHDQTLDFALDKESDPDKLTALSTLLSSLYSYSVRRDANIAQALAQNVSSPVEALNNVWDFCLENISAPEYEKDFKILLIMKTLLEDEGNNFEYKYNKKDFDTILAISSADGINRSGVIALQILSSSKEIPRDALIEVIDLNRSPDILYCSVEAATNNIEFDYVVKLSEEGNTACRKAMARRQDEFKGYLVQQLGEESSEFPTSMIPKIFGWNWIND